VSNDLSECDVKWAPMRANMTVQEFEAYQGAFERLKGIIRFKVTSKLSYLRTSPNLSFSLHDTVKVHHG
jgi:ribosome-binding factor A